MTGTSKPSIISPKIMPVVVELDPDAFDNLIRGHGVKLQHYRAQVCPIGKTDQFDTRSPQVTCTKCSNGFLYTYMGDITCLFTSNGESTAQQDFGSMETSSLSITAPRCYDGTENPVHLITFDRLYLAEENILVTNWQLAQYSSAGADKMRFPVAEIESVVDSAGKNYNSNDYTIKDGLIHWGDNNPGYDASLDKGVVYSIVYRYRPYYYVRNFSHEIRIGNVQNIVTGERTAYRMGQSCSIVREYIFENKINDIENPSNDLRSSKIPDGTFGER